VPVGTAVVRADTITDQVTVVGRLVPIPGGAALLTAPAAGVVRTIPVQIGEVVAAGQLLVDLDVPELASSARELRAAAEIAERDARRQQELFKDGIASQKQVEEKNANATAAKSAADAAEQLLARARVRSPISGAVQKVAAHPGERVEAGAPLVEVINPGALDLIGATPAAQLGRLKVGQPALVSAEGVSEGRRGLVRAIAPAVDSVTNAGQVVVRVPSPGGLRAGAGATARITLGTHRNALVVPDSALVLVGDAMSVFVIGPDSVAHVRPVTVGVREGGRVEVSGELQPGDRVATTGSYGLVDGMHVRADTAAPPPTEKE
jgi:RND family efflux transporter MFP subunit